MPITEQHVRDTLTAYLDQRPLDKDSLSVLSEVLDEAGGHIVGRGEYRGHVTAGALLLRPDGRVLLIEHLALRKWLFPGGHLEDPDETLRGAALRELAEETGIDPAQVVPDGTVPLHIDVHPIPANPAKGEPDHQHFDFRFLFRTTADVTGLQAEEVTDYSWTFPDMITAEPLRSRLLALTP
ncbi:NUDIX domain-containing protein [Streptomyces cocklensis]|jgi:8-oxo-dGTP pyrophosphatase MutT (NUDIX family)|uniref:NUDIX hydrolase n=1 Tax=Actinacidiphila cocklensis TaxID=887465 RepID=UPI00203D554F|nr:NUDIX domain-containing protein [Actinacidiphila cocklensis]MDD1057981.1 NUDIX domain-containing protein [Actinacidiphila cocklensis]